MPLSSHITHSHQVIARNLVLDRKLIFLGVRQSIFIIESRRASDRTERVKELGKGVIRRPSPGMRSRRVRRRLRRREKLGVDLAISSSNERSGERRKEQPGGVSVRG